MSKQNHSPEVKRTQGASTLGNPTRKKCRDCLKNRLLKFFYAQRKYLSKKGKGLSIHYCPYCNTCQYKRNKRSQSRSHDVIIKIKKYQKQYNPVWQRKFRNKKSSGSEV